MRSRSSSPEAARRPSTCWRPTASTKSARSIEHLYGELRSRGRRRPRLPLRAAAPAAAPDEADALAAVALFDRLLDLFGSRYERAKEERLAVDFDDLELIAGELLAGNEALRGAWAERFELLMVDEFQDTNPRQLAILRCLERENLFTVGDELQSIYGFRHADVSLFRERRAELAASGRGAGAEEQLPQPPQRCWRPSTWSSRSASRSSARCSTAARRSPARPPSPRSSCC